jgi:hypothetical protein
VKTSPLFDETSEAVLKLARGKTRVRTGGLISIYRLRNGWIARRQTPESTWSRRVYWNIFQDESSLRQHQALGGGESRLTRAIANVLNDREGKKPVISSRVS